MAKKTLSNLQELKIKMARLEKAMSKYLLLLHQMQDIHQELVERNAVTEIELETKNTLIKKYQEINKELRGKNNVLKSFNAELQQENEKLRDEIKTLCDVNRQNEDKITELSRDIKLVPYQHNEEIINLCRDNARTSQFDFQVETYQFEKRNYSIPRTTIIKKSDKISIVPILERTQTKLKDESFYEKTSQYIIELTKYRPRLHVVISSSGLLKNTERINPPFFKPLYEILKSLGIEVFNIRDLPSNFSGICDHVVVIDFCSALHKSCGYMNYNFPNLEISYISFFGKDQEVDKKYFIKV